MSVLFCFFVGFLISPSYSSLIFLWRLFHQLEIVTPLKRIQMGIQCLSFNSLLFDGFCYFKVSQLFGCFKHHFDGALSWFVDQDLEDRAIFWAHFLFVCIFCIVLLFWICCWRAQLFVGFLIPFALSLFALKIKRKRCKRLKNALHQQPSGPGGLQWALRSSVNQWYSDILLGLIWAEYYGMNRK